MYPFGENKIPEKERITIEDIPQNLRVVDMRNNFYPHVISSSVAYISGITNDKWDDYYESIYVYCSELNIPNLVFIWSPTITHIVKIGNWRDKFPLPPNFNNMLTNDYNVGFTIQLIGSSVRNSILACPFIYPYQIYISPSTQCSSSMDTKLIPGFNYDNIPAFDIIKKNKLKIYCHASHSVNIGNSDSVSYIVNLIRYCNAHNIKAVTFKCGSNKDIEVGKQIMLYNIVNGIRNSKFRPDQDGTTKFLLQTPSGKGNELLTDIYDFINFCSQIPEDIRNLFAITVNTCHIHQLGYQPYYYMLEILKYFKVELVQLNDSEKTWGSHRDLYEIPGNGRIPWIYLMKIAQISKLMNITMIRDI